MGNAKPGFLSGLAQSRQNDVFSPNGLFQRLLPHVRWAMTMLARKNRPQRMRLFDERLDEQRTCRARKDEVEHARILRLKAASLEKSNYWYGQRNRYIDSLGALEDAFFALQRARVRGGKVTNADPAASDTSYWLWLDWVSTQRMENSRSSCQHKTRPLFGPFPIMFWNPSSHSNAASNHSS